MLDGETYSLLENNGENHLHGGAIGFDKVVWAVDEYVEGKSLALSYLAKDKEEGTWQLCWDNIRWLMITRLLLTTTRRPIRRRR